MTIPTSVPLARRDGTTTHLMPLWDTLVDVAATCPAWACVRAYCDITTGDTVAMWDGDDGIGGPADDPLTDTDFAAYVWHADGTVDMVSTTDYLWWCLDDLIWGYDDDCILNLIGADGYTLMTPDAFRDLARLHGVVYAGDVRWDELGMDDLLADLGLDG